jgi:hypothetical protein
LIKLNQLKGMESFRVEDLHPALDQGNLWVLISEIEALMEWHDRFWPEPSEPKRQIRIGFQS